MKTIKEKGVKVTLRENPPTGGTHQRILLDLPGSIGETKCQQMPD